MYISPFRCERKKKLSRACFPTVGGGRCSFLAGSISEGRHGTREADGIDPFELPKKCVFSFLRRLGTLGSLLFRAAACPCFCFFVSNQPCLCHLSFTLSMRARRRLPFVIRRLGKYIEFSSPRLLTTQDIIDRIIRNRQRCAAADCV